MALGLGIDSAGTGHILLVSRSTDGGLTWSNPVTAAESSGSFWDKTWIVCDTWSGSPYYGNCYIQFDDNGAGNAMRMLTSTDGGATWGAGHVGFRGYVGARRAARRAAERNGRRCRTPRTTAPSTRSARPTEAPAGGKTCSSGARRCTAWSACATRRYRPPRWTEPGRSTWSGTTASSARVVRRTTSS